MVISQKMSVNEMDYRGSKSKCTELTNVRNNFVKEQRLDGSFCMKHKSMQIRYNLMGFERNYPIKVLSKQLNLNKKDFSTLNKNSKLNTWFVTGFADAEASFHISIIRNNKLQIGWSITPRFQIGLHKIDLNLLLQLKEFFGDIGSITKQGTDYFQYRVSAINDLFLITAHFDKYKLITQKNIDFQLFKKVLNIIKNKKHLTNEGFQEILACRASMNWGLSKLLKTNFVNTNIIERPNISLTNIPDPNWLSGFVSGEGCFFINISKSNTKLGKKVNLIFNISQNEREKNLLELIIKYLGCGKIYKNSKSKVIEMRVTKLLIITKILIPFFKQNPIQGVKFLDFLSFCKATNLINEDKHLTKEGLELIRTIKIEMNKRRKI
jgi:hypothetical protein